MEYDLQFSVTLFLMGEGLPFNKGIVGLFYSLPTGFFACRPYGVFLLTDLSFV